jgi:hypothetical protein
MPACDLNTCVFGQAREQVKAQGHQGTEGGGKWIAKARREERAKELWWRSLDGRSLTAEVRREAKGRTRNVCLFCLFSRRPLFDRPGGLLPHGGGGVALGHCVRPTSLRRGSVQPGLSLVLPTVTGRRCTGSFIAQPHSGPLWRGDLSGRIPNAIVNSVPLVTEHDRCAVICSFDLLLSQQRDSLLPSIPTFPSAIARQSSTRLWWIRMGESRSASGLGRARPPRGDRNCIARFNANHPIAIRSWYGNQGRPAEVGLRMLVLTGFCNHFRKIRARSRNRVSLRALFGEIIQPFYRQYLRRR